MEALLVGSGLNTAFLFGLCVMLAVGVYKTAVETARKEYRDLSRWVLALHVAFFWIGGSAFAAGALTGLVNNGAVDGQVWTFLFAIIVVPGLAGLWQGLNSPK